MGLHFGAHMSSSKGFVRMFRDTQVIGGNTMQFFVRNPRGVKSKDLNEADMESFRLLISENDFMPVLAHAPYTMNICSPNIQTRSFGLQMFREDLLRMEYIPGNYYNFHPGCAVGQADDVAISLIADGLNEVLWQEMQTTVLLETMAGKGSEIGKTFGQLRQIIDRTAFSDKLGVCLDTCHVWDAGYDIVGDLDGVLSAFDREIGLGRLKAIHLNDSKNPLGSRKDRHACIGEGAVGEQALLRVLRHPLLCELPFFLETPTDDAGHGAEIARLCASL